MMINKKIDISYVILLLSVCIALGFIFLLAKENSDLRVKLNSGSLPLASGTDLTGTGGYISGPPELQAGDLVPSFTAIDLTGASFAVNFDGKKKYFIYVFSAFCGTCMTQVGDWATLGAEAKAAGYQPVGISLENPGKKSDRLQPLKEISTLVMMPDMSIQRSFRATSIPMLGLIDEKGKVEWSYYGILNEKVKKDFAERIEHGKQVH